MLQRILMYMLMILIAMQSVDAMADAVKYHQPNTTYTETDYFFNKSSVENNALKSADGMQDQAQENTSSADHCCYCHGFSCMEITDNSLNLQLRPGNEKSLFVNNSYPSTILFPDLRPPII